MTVKCYKGGIYSPYVHVNFIINLIHHVKTVLTVHKQSLLYIKKILLVSCAHSLDFRYYEFVRKYHIDRFSMKYYIPILFVILDIDECLNRSHACDVTANCTNTDGSHICTCKEGYTGDGHSCQGIIIT